MPRVIHFLNGLRVGGKERVALQLARRARREGFQAGLVLFDVASLQQELDFDPRDLDVRFLPRRGGLDLRYVRALSRFLHDEAVDVVHAHNDSAVFYACAASFLLGRKRPAVCATFHTRPGHDTWTGRRLTWLAAHRADCITAVSDELGRLLVGDGWVPRCTTVLNGVDLEEFSPVGGDDGWRARLEVPAGGFLVGHVGRFDPIKRHVDLLEAARLLARRRPGVVLALVGDGPEQPRIRAAARDLANVRMVPNIADVAPFLRACDAFALCSEHECTPRVLLEAMACGRACVVTDVGGVPSIVAPRELPACALLVPPRQPEALAAAIDALAADEPRRRQLEGLALDRARDYSSDQEWRAYAQLYSDALDRIRS